MSQLRVLVVDDDQAILDVMSQYFNQRGDACAVFTNGPDALNAMHDRFFDVMLSDIKMPAMDGLEVVRHAKELQPNTACILMSGVGTRRDIISALKAGVFDFVDKPITDLQEFTMIVERAAASSRLAQDRDALLENLKQQNARLEFSLLRLHEAFGRLRQQEEALESDLGKAQLVQRRFLPTGFPATEGLDIFGHYAPCEHLGGDFFGTIPLSDGKLAVYLADVAGHGVSAAMITVTVRELMRTPQRSGNGDDMHAAPDQVLSYMNEALRAEAFDPPIFVTMLYAVYDPAAGSIRLAAAGHPPPLLISGVGEKRIVAAHGPVLGGKAAAHYTVTEFNLQPGDAVLFYSDGLTEARDLKGRELSADRLHETLVRYSHSPAAEIGGAVERTVLAHLEGVPADDDITFIVARRPLGSRLPVSQPTGDARIVPKSVKIVAPTTVRFSPPEGRGRIIGGWHGRQCIVRLRGVVTWQMASSFREILQKARADGEGSLLIDLAECEVMDSTMLGVILQHGAEVVLHQPGLRVMHQLQEMDVVDHFVFSHDPCPSLETPIGIEPTEAKEPCSELILSAHEALMEASVSNRLRFGDVVAALRPSEDTDR